MHHPNGPNWIPMSTTTIQYYPLLTNAANGTQYCGPNSTHTYPYYPHYPILPDTTWYYLIVPLLSILSWWPNNRYPYYPYDPCIPQMRPIRFLSSTSTVSYPLNVYHSQNLRHFSLCVTLTLLLTGHNMCKRGGKCKLGTRCGVSHVIPQMLDCSFSRWLVFWWTPPRHSMSSDA